MPIRAVLFDLDGVIRRYPERQPVLRFDWATRALDDETLRAVTTGKITDEEWRRLVTDRLLEGAHGEGLTESAAASLVDEMFDAGYLDDDAIALVRRVRATCVVGLMSNATTGLGGALERLGIPGDFDHVFNSAELGVAKPDPRIFEAACAAFALRPNACAFVDDTKGHVEAALAFGMRAHHFVSVTRAREWLAGLGVPV